MKSLFAVLLLVFATPILAAEAPPHVSDLGFFAGDWSLVDGETFWEEQWTAPRGDSMLGMCRALKNGETFFYEMLTIEQQPSGPVMTLRHFNRGLEPWEKNAVVVMPLVSLKGSEAVFEQADKKVRLTYRRKDDELYALLEKWKDGKRSAHEFTYKLAE